MTTDELENVIREELRAQAGRQPSSAATKLAVMRAVAGQPVPAAERSWGRWTLPVLAAAAVVLLAVGSIVVPKALHSQPVRPAVPVSSTVGSPTSTPTRPVPISDNWFNGIPVGPLPHASGLCPAGTGVTAGPSMASGLPLPGEPARIWMQQVACDANLVDPYPEPYEVYAYGPSGPQLLQTLAYQPGDPRALQVTGLEWDGHQLTLTESGLTTGDSACCRSLLFSQKFTWQPRTGTQAHGHFVAGPQVNVVKPCTAAQLRVTSSPLSSQSGDAVGLLLKYTSNDTVPCTLSGYPSATAVDHDGHSLGTARRTLSGFFGGVASGSAAPIVMVPTRTASAVIEWSSAAYTQGSSCYQQARISSAAPGATASQRFGALVRICDLQVHPVVAGATGKG